MDAGQKFDVLVEMMESTAAVVVDQDALVYPSVHNDEDDERMIELSWIDDGSACEIFFKETDLVDLTVSEDGDEVILTDTKGEKYYLKPLTVDCEAINKVGDNLIKVLKAKP